MTNAKSSSIATCVPTNDADLNCFPVQTKRLFTCYRTTAFTQGLPPKPNQGLAGGPMEMRRWFGAPAPGNFQLAGTNLQGCSPCVPRHIIAFPNTKF